MSLEPLDRNVGISMSYTDEMRYMHGKTKNSRWHPIFCITFTKGMSPFLPAITFGWHLRVLTEDGQSLYTFWKIYRTYYFKLEKDETFSMDFGMSLLKEVESEIKEKLNQTTGISNSEGLSELTEENYKEGTAIIEKQIHYWQEAQAERIAQMNEDPEAKFFKYYPIDPTI